MLVVKAVLFVVAVLGVLISSPCAFAQDATTPEIRNRYDFSEKMFINEPGKIEFMWRSKIYGEVSQLETQSAEVGGFGIFGYAKYTLVKSLEARVFLRGRFEAGRSQSFFGDIEPASGIYVIETAMRWSPFLLANLDILDLKVGVLDQNWMDMPMLTYGRSFPGASADLHYDITKNIRVGAVSQYLVPTSQTLSARTIEREATPSFITHTLFAGFDTDDFQVRGTANYYEYNDLPSFVAFESQKRGNDTLFINGPNNSEFRFPFRGWFTQGTIEGNLTKEFRAQAYINVIKNKEAPTGFNDGQTIGLKGLLRTTDVNFELGGEKLFIESDVVPGVYNAWAYGNTNKEGYGATFDVYFNKKNFRIRAQYYDVKLINPDPLQQNQQYFYLGVETGYDKI